MSIEKSQQTPIKIAAASDLHIRTEGWRYKSPSEYADLIAQMSSVADVLIICGDFTDHKESFKSDAQTAARIFRDATKPVFGVLGNHDHDGDPVVVSKILSEEGGITMMEGQAYAIEKDGSVRLGIAGAKGFEGGFFPGAGQNYFGEHAKKNWIAERDKENEKFELAVRGLDPSIPNVVAMHYSPIRGTLAGENPEVYVFLGNSGIEDVVDKYRDRVNLVLHGHAHTGSPRGKTRGGVDVFNVAIQVLEADAKREPNVDHESLFRLIEL